MCTQHTRHTFNCSPYRLPWERQCVTYRACAHFKRISPNIFASHIFCLRCAMMCEHLKIRPHTHTKSGKKAQYITRGPIKNGKTPFRSLARSLTHTKASVHHIYVDVDSCKTLYLFLISERNESERQRKINWKMFNNVMARNCVRLCAFLLWTEIR